MVLLLEAFWLSPGMSTLSYPASMVLASLGLPALSWHVHSLDLCWLLRAFISPLLSQLSASCTLFFFYGNVGGAVVLSAFAPAGQWFSLCHHNWFLLFLSVVWPFSASSSSLELCS